MGPTYLKYFPPSVPPTLSLKWSPLYKCVSRGCFPDGHVKCIPKKFIPGCQVSWAKKQAWNQRGGRTAQLSTTKSRIVLRQLSWFYFTLLFCRLGTLLKKICNKCLPFLIESTFLGNIRVFSSWKSMNPSRLQEASVKKKNNNVLQLPFSRHPRGLFFSASRGSCSSWILYDDVTCRGGHTHTARTTHTRHKVEQMGGPRLPGGDTLVAQRGSWSPSRWSVHLLAPLMGSRDLVRVILHTMFLIFKLKWDERWKNLLWAEDKESLSGIYNVPPPTPINSISSECQHDIT